MKELAKIKMGKVRTAGLRRSVSIRGRRYVLAVLALNLQLLTFNSVFAANPATINLQITVAPALSISVNTPEYSFGNMPVNATSISTSAIVVTNDSSGRTEDYKIQAANSASWTLNTSTNGVDQFALRALFASTQPAQGDFNTRFSTLGTSAENCNARYSVFGSSGNNVSSGAERNLWFMLLTPTEVTSTVQQSITVTITAADAGEF